MAGPNSAPNGDTTVVMGHINEVFVCDVHKGKHLDKCYAEQGTLVPNKHGHLVKSPCHVVGLRNYLAKRNRLRTGKTR